MPAIDQGLADWLKSASLDTSANAAGVAWGTRGVTFEQDSPLDVKAEAEVEAARIAAFMAGPLVKDQVLVKGRRRDLLFKCVEASFDRLGYALAGDEVVVNGLFTTNTANWTAINAATLTVNSNRLRVTGSANSYGLALQTAGLITGKKYRYSVDHFVSTVAKFVQIGDSSGGPPLVHQTAGSLSSGNFSGTFIAGVNPHLFNLGIDGTTGFVEYDNFSVKPAVERVFVIGVAENDNGTTILTVLRKIS